MVRDADRTRSPVAEKPRADFGATLRAARERRGLSLRQIAASTKIALAQLEALERNDIRRLPGGLFTRAFVRAYAAEVGLDAEATVREFLAQFPDDGLKDGSPYADDAQDQEAFESQQRIAKTVVRLVLLSMPLAALLVFLTLRNGGDDRAARAPARGDAAPAVAEVAEPGASPADPGAVVGAPEGAPGAPVGAAGQTRPLSIAIHPRAACWVSLVLDGEKTFARVMAAGEREVHEASREIVINVGDAGAFDFTLNQQPGRSLGSSGQVVSARITPQNYLDYISR